MKIGKGEWYEEAASRPGRRGMCRLAETSKAQSHRRAETTATREVQNEVCGRKFRRESDKKRHKCVDERRKPLSQQKGAVQCEMFHRWFHSRGGTRV